MPQPFLSPEWIAEVRAIREEYRDHAPVAQPPEVRVNLVITDVPFGDGEVHAHTDTSNGAIEIELGHLPEADLTITVDHDTAKALVVDQQPAAALKAFLFGKIRVDGDITQIGSADGGFDAAALLRSLDLSSLPGLGDLDPTAAAIGDRIKAVTL